MFSTFIPYKTFPFPSTAKLPKASHFVQHHGRHRGVQVETNQAFLPTHAVNLGSAEAQRGT